MVGQRAEEVAKELFAFKGLKKRIVLERTWMARSKKVLVVHIVLQSLGWSQVVLRFSSHLPPACGFERQVSGASPPTATLTFVSWRDHSHLGFLCQALEEVFVRELLQGVDVHIMATLLAGLALNQIDQDLKKQDIVVCAKMSLKSSIQKLQKTAIKTMCTSLIWLNFGMYDFVEKRPGKDLKKPSGDSSPKAGTIIPRPFLTNVSLIFFCELQDQIFFLMTSLVHKIHWDRAVKETGNTAGENRLMVQLVDCCPGELSVLQSS